MIYQKQFSDVRPQLLVHQQPWFAAGLNIRSRSTQYCGFQAEDELSATELVIGKGGEVEICFEREVERLTLEFYVACEAGSPGMEVLLEIERPDPDWPLRGCRHFHWLVLAGDDLKHQLPGRLASQLVQQALPGPIQRLYITTSTAGQMHLCGLQWEPVRRN